ncbi:phospholipase D-like domain-containing protein [Agromyces mariniharenae]|uniref:Phosphatidylserine/phosphatidylglycerophosphate/ cardiolipin synthase family protein n=1 Tax=Agromyces mariniharenae TaxID=2604423 RepID=A0A5S4V1W0_9MICO|nr:phospholipase D-like domain-containing protein [Agromyces mariniharenae]TYL51181.1 phosphatidylserine/phosphatidylglycerophosphate/cardiolipin synthase family protein [Agromyces mariniharenae]
MVSELDRTILARDVYRSWRARVQAATESVRVFTPYLDRLLDRLLENATLGTNALSVVTDLSPASGALDYRGQLIGVRSLLRRGIEVRSIPRLHAKILVCDGKLATVGSQNFTSYARRSKETTIVVPDDVSDTAFAATLEDWYQAATPVSLEFVESLLVELDEATRVAREARERLTEGFDEHWSSYLQTLEAERTKREAANRQKPLALQLARAIRRSTDRQARPFVWARLRRAGAWDEYETLLADNDATLTTWLTRDGNGGVSYAGLKRLNFYPIILNPSGRMGFGRVAQTRITYVRSSVKWSQPRVLFGRSYNVTVRFPSDDLESANVSMTLGMAGEPAYASLELRLRFDGLEATLNDWDITTDPRARAYAEDEVDAQANRLKALVDQLHGPTSLAALVRSSFAAFTFKELGLGNRNADDFFPRGWVRITRIDYGERPVLVVTANKG